MLATIDPQVRLERLARACHWGLVPLGYKEVPTQPRFVNGYWETPFDEDSIKNRGARKRLEVVRAANIPIQGVFIRHETTRLLPNPDRPHSFPWFSTFIAAGCVALLIAAGWYAHHMLMGAATATSMAVIAAPVALDPAICITLRDGSTFELYRWYE